MKEGETTISQEMSQRCSVNGVEVNCSEFNNKFPDLEDHGIKELDGVCPGWNDNKTLIDCIKEVEEQQR